MVGEQRGAVEERHYVTEHVKLMDGRLYCPVCLHNVGGDALNDKVRPPGYR